MADPGAEVHPWPTVRIARLTLMKVRLVIGGRKLRSLYPMAEMGDLRGALRAHVEQHALAS